MGRQIAASGIVFPIYRNRHFSVYFLYFLEPLGASGLYLHGLPAITALLRIRGNGRSNNGRYGYGYGGYGGDCSWLRSYSWARYEACVGIY